MNIYDYKKYFLGAGILFFLLYLPYTILINYDTQTQTWQKIIAVGFKTLLIK